VNQNEENAFGLKPMTIQLYHVVEDTDPTYYHFSKTGSPSTLSTQHVLE